jgi:hypothetical protein
LRPGYRLQSEPEPPAAAAETVEQPERAPLPPRPEEIQPERKTISPVDLAESRKAGVTASAESLRQQGVRRTINALYYTAPAAVLSTLLGHPGYAFTEVAMAPVILAGSHALAGMLERPEVVNWISKVTPKDVAVFNRLPAEEKAVFTQNLNTLVKAAKKKNLPVAQALNAFVVGSSATASTPKTLQQLRQEALKRQQQGEQAETPDETAPGDEEPAAAPTEQEGSEPNDTTQDESEPEY